MNPPDAHPAQALWRDPAQGLVVRIGQLIQTRGLHPARTVALLPYAQLMGVARAAWTQCGAAGFMPRFETTRNWARSAGGFVPGQHDIAFDMARDLLSAQSLLGRSDLLGARRIALAGRLVEIAHQLAPLAAAQLPQQRSAWARDAQALIGAGQDSEWFGTESALNLLALTWAAVSGYATDVLLQGAARAQADALIVLDGLQADPLAERLAALFGDQALHLPLAALASTSCVADLHAAADPEDEAERAAACVLRHLADGHVPVALVATDRALARRIGAQLQSHGAALHDETGWKLSTTRAAASLMVALRACAHDAASDAVLDWAKHAPAFDGSALRKLEARLRQRGLRDWQAWCAGVAANTRDEDAALWRLTDAIEAQRATLARVRTLPDWLAATRALLQSTEQWPALAADTAGSAVIAALDLDAQPSELDGGRFTLAEFTAWVRDVLEAASTVLADAQGAEPQVVVLPLHQLVGRPFGAVVVPGCDDQRLPLSPEPPGPWTSAQRAALGLPSRDRLEAAQRAAWGTALATPRVDLLWRQFDASGEPVRPSPLVQQLRMRDAARAADDPRTPVQRLAEPTPRPQPRGNALPLAKLSATAYDDLRRCPYRFFALRQLALSSRDELDAELDKRDFGNWLHAVLAAFHQALNTAPTPDRQARLAMISIAAEQVTRDFALSEAEFLPFAAAWPAVRDGYLEWLAGHEEKGALFSEAEPWKEQGLGRITLVGRLDRIDRMPDGRAYVIDYKTESLDTSKQRVKEPTEDTQLAFYAALLDEDSPRAAYVNVGEKGSGTQTVEQTDVVAARDALVEGIVIDLQRIADGVALPALGEGTVCEHCAARGLCRKDFWNLAG